VHDGFGGAAYDWIKFREDRSDAPGISQTPLIGTENIEKFVTTYPAQCEKMSRPFPVTRKSPEDPAIIGSH